MDKSTPDSLRPGDLVGSWRVEGYAGRGTYGAVYRARRSGHPDAVPVALKLGLFAYDPRFIREVELLSRAHHPSVPELLDHGGWHTDEGRGHPYLVMRWVNGLPLYEWARMYEPSSRQVLQVLAQVAWALEVLHTTGGLHRDVKGDNILVEPDGRAFLMDFGSGTWPGAPPLTETLMPPGTREYRGPEALRFQWQHLRQCGVSYEARPFDDLYALGVSMYRLVTGVYPPPGTDPEARQDPLGVPPPPRLLPQALNAQVVPELAALIEQILAAEPEARGLAREVAEAAEVAAKRAGPGADVPLTGPQQGSGQTIAVPVKVEVEVPTTVPAPAPGKSVIEPIHAREEPEFDCGRMVLKLGLAAGISVLVMVASGWLGHVLQAEPRQFVRVEEPDEHVEREDGRASLADASVTTEVSSQESSAARPEAIALEMPEQPLPGQRLAPCRGRGEIAIRGGCWAPWTTLSPPCGDEAYEWQGACYWPLYYKPRPRTSHEPR